VTPARLSPILRALEMVSRLGTMRESTTRARLTKRMPSQPRSSMMATTCALGRTQYGNSRYERREAEKQSGTCVT